jgi:hypothetical protein
VNFIPQLTIPNAMVSLVFLDNDLILYNYKTDDPWYSAHTPISKFDSTANASEAANDEGPYFADEPVGVLGCSTRRFICNPDMPGAECINSLSRNKSVLAIQRAWPNPRDQQQIFPFLAASYQYGIGKGSPDAMYQLSGAPVLLARNTMTNNRQTARLPSDQWQIEREHIFTATLAAWQSSIVAYARGSWYGHLECKPDFPCERLCHSQVSLVFLYLSKILTQFSANSDDQFPLFQYMDTSHIPVIGNTHHADIIVRGRHLRYRITTYLPRTFSAT